MKCIYCNSQIELTSSDIITYAITGAKLTKSFVCKKHNAFTNDKYEKKFVSDLNYFRNHLGLTTRDGNPIQYKADILVDGIKIHDVKVSNKKSFFAPKGVVAGIDENGNKVLIGPMDRIQKISKGKATLVDTKHISAHKTISSDIFTGYHAIHSMAKMAYEWYCYINNIEEYRDEYKELVDYILEGDINYDFVDIIIDDSYYFVIDNISEIGTNSFFQYDDIDGYKYVVIDFWNVISYRIRICKSINNQQSIYFRIYLYHIDGSKSESMFASLPQDSRQSRFKTIKPHEITADIWRIFAKRSEKIMSTMILSIHILKREVDELSKMLKKYDERKIDIDLLLGFEDNNIVNTIDIISQLYFNKEKYKINKTFNQNLPIMLNIKGDTIFRTQEEKMKFIKSLVEMDKENKLSEYIWNSIYFFNEIYDNQANLLK